MNTAKTLEHRAFLELLELALSRTKHGREDACLYALTWLATGRLALAERLRNAFTVSDLINENGWKNIPEDLLPLTAKALIWSSESASPYEVTTRTKALEIVTRYMEHHGTQQWDLTDATWDQASAMHKPLQDGFAIAPELCELAFDALDPEPHSSIWIPFDPTGQLVMRAVKRNLHVTADGPGQRSETYLRLLLVIHDPMIVPEETICFSAPRSSGRPEISADFVLAMPPIGQKLTPDTVWRQWESNDRGSIDQGQFDKSDVWSIAAFLPRASKRAVFITPPSILFARGQEQRLREHLLIPKNPLTAVVALPNRQIANTNLAPALLLFKLGHNQRSVKLIDASDMTHDIKSSMRFERQLKHQEVAALMEGKAEDSLHVCDAQIDELQAQDFNLVPSRYLRKALPQSTEKRHPLGELVSVIRAPVSSKDPTAVTVQEIGFPELDRWLPVIGPFARTTSIQARKLEGSSLRHMDIVLSVKGTPGKSALIGPMPGEELLTRPAGSRHSRSSSYHDIPDNTLVPSQSCIALRIHRDDVHPAFLFLFFRSDDFKQQVEALRVGTAIAHVTPSTLLKEIQVPLPTSEIQQRVYLERYGELCKLESAIEKAKAEMEQIRGQLWSVYE